MKETILIGLFLSIEDDDYDPVAELKKQNEVKSQWDDEEEEEEETKPSVQESQPRNPNKKKPIGKQAEEKEKKTSAPVQPQELTEKQRQQLVEASDFKNTLGLFSGIESVIDLSNPKDERDFDVLGSTVGEKLQAYQVKMSVACSLLSTNLNANLF